MVVTRMLVVLVVLGDGLREERNPRVVVAGTRGITLSSKGATSGDIE